MEATEPFERLAAARMNAGYHTAMDAARAMGVTPSTYTSHENGTRGLRPDAAKRYAAFFRVDVEWLLFGSPASAKPDASAKSPHAGEAPAPNARFIRDIAPPDAGFGGPRDVPQLGIAVGGSGAEADFQFNGETIDYAPRPPGIINRRGVYALWVANDSMYPKYEENERLYVDSLRAPAIGDYVVLELHPTEEGEPGPGFIKKLVRRTPTRIVVSQFNPPKELEFDRDAVKSLHRVIPYQELLGV